MVIHESKKSHDELAIHAICDSTVSRDALTEVFDFEGALEAGSEEASKGRDERGECCEGEDMKLNGCDVEGTGVGGTEGNGIRTR